ncbi:MAG: uracil-DNA glycosylase [Beijerinckiaceae bacterium]
MAFYRDHGVEDALDEQPHDRFAESAGPGDFAARSAGQGAGSASRAEPAQRVPEGSPPRGSVAARAPIPAPVAPDAAASEAREQARRAQTLEELRAVMAAFDGCALKKTALQLVFADGNPQARIMIVGEGPGQDEDRQGVPFVGRSGQLLDRMLAAIGLDRTCVYIANVVPWRPPGNRTPTVQEMAICKPFIERQIELVNPDILIALGNPALQTLFRTRDGVTKIRGRWLNYQIGARTISAMATFHPSYLLRTPAHKVYAWRDMKAVRARLAAMSSAAPDQTAGS